MRPETTGDTENGRSIRVIRKVLPRNSNLAIAQAAASPKTRFERHDDRRDEEGELDRRERVGLGERVEIGGDAPAQRLDEDGCERQPAGTGSEDERDADQRHAPSGDSVVTSRRRGASWRAWRQTWPSSSGSSLEQLMASNEKEIASIMVAIAVAAA